MINFLLLALIIYLTGIFFQIHILYKLAYFFMGLHILIKLYHYNLEKNLVLEHQLKEDHVFLNEQIEGQIRVENKSRFPVIWLKIVEVLPRKLTPVEEKDVTYLGPGEIKTWQVKLKGRRRGLYFVGPLEWESGDMLGYDILQGYLEKLPVYVFPRLLTMAELGLPSRLPFGDIGWPQPIYKDPYQMVGIREYQPSDRLNRIHWKATARSGKLQVRKNQSTVSLETALVLNLVQHDYGLKWLDRKTELAITAAASLAYYLTRVGQPFSFKTNGENGVEGGSVSHPVGSGELHLQKVLETLACIEVSKKDNFLELLSGYMELPWGGTIIILTDTDTNELIRTANNLISRGYNIKIMLLGKRVEHPEYLHRPFTAPLSIHHLKREKDIYELSKL